jgi:DNA-binding beta-propeller fold protein YncE
MRQTLPSPRHTLLAVLAFLCATSLLVATPALALRGHTFGKSFGSSGAGEGQFSGPQGIAINEETGDVYVVDRGNSRVERFTAEGSFLSQFNGAGTFERKGKVETGLAFSRPLEVAVDNSCVIRKLSEPSLTHATCEKEDPSNGDVYVVDQGQSIVDKFSPTGTLIGQLVVPKVGAFLEEWSVAVDTHGNVWVSEKQTSPHRGFDEFGNGAEGEFKEFPEGEFKEFLQLKDPSGSNFSGGDLSAGLALDPAGNFYTAIGFSNVVGNTIAKFNPKATLLTEALVEEMSSGVAAELSASSVYLDNVSSVRRFDGAEPPNEVERFGLGHLPDICTPPSSSECEVPNRGGVAVDSTTGTVFVAVAPLDQVQVYPLEPPGPPTVEGESVSEVTADSAKLRAVVNPRGAATAFHFEYGPCTSEATCSSSPYGHPTPEPDGEVGSDFEAHEVDTEPRGLLAGTVYHFRAVAHNVVNGEPHETVGAEQVFTTQPAGVLGLPDGRAWEMVSPPQKQGSLIAPIGESTPIQAAVSGDAITYPTHSPTEAETLGFTNFVQVISARGEGDWSSRDITVPHERATGQSVGKGNEYRFSSEDLSQGVVQPFGVFVPSLSLQASEQTAFLHSNFTASSPTAFCITACFTPLVTAKNTLEGVAFGEEGTCPPELICGPLFVGASGDLKHVILRSNVGLSEAPEDKGGLYEWSAGRLQLISILPGGNPATTPVPTMALGHQNEVTRNAVSPDGQRVVWSTAGHLYLRDLTSPESVELDKGLSGEPVFQAANRQTTRVFFTENGDLYMYDTEAGTRTQLTSGADVQGLIAGVSEDGTNVFFTANGELTKGEGAVKGNCQGEIPTPALRCNLYELRQSGGAWAPRLVAVLSGADHQDFSSHLTGDLTSLTARVAPNGRYLAFMSQLPLTGYDNRDAVSGKPDAEVFLYDAIARHLTCASCNPTGARPQGIESKKLTVNGPVQGFGSSDGSTWLAASVPGWTEYRLLTSLYQSRYLSNSGRLFFNSSDALSPQDVNGTEDVYQWEPPGVGNCTVTNASYSPRSGGCVGLISKGTSREESGFLDASETGGDVFFTTTAKLSPQDTDSAYDVYDAHECTPGSPCIAPSTEPPPPCSGESSCKAASTPQPQIFGPPASATFSGPGNLIAELASPPPTPKPVTTAQKLAKALHACRAKYRHSKRRRSRCEREAHRRFRAAGAKKADRNRRAR